MFSLRTFSRNVREGYMLGCGRDRWRWQGGSSRSATALSNFSARHSSPASIFPCFSSSLLRMLLKKHVIQYLFWFLRPNESFFRDFERSLRQRRKCLGLQILWCKEGRGKKFYVIAEDGNPLVSDRVPVFFSAQFCEVSGVSGVRV